MNDDLSNPRELLESRSFRGHNFVLKADESTYEREGVFQSDFQIFNFPRKRAFVFRSPFCEGGEKFRI